jgi:hypothetical protein
VFTDPPKETGREAHRLDVVPRQRPAHVVECRPDIRQESDWTWIFVGLDNLRRRVEGPVNLPFCLKMFPRTPTPHESSSFVYQRGKYGMLVGWVVLRARV